MLAVFRLADELPAQHLVFAVRRDEGQLFFLDGQQGETFFRAASTLIAGTSRVRSV